MELIKDEASLRRVLEALQRPGTDNQTVEVKSCVGGLTKDDALGDRRFLDSATLVGPIPAIIDDLEAAVARNARTGAVVEGAFRRDVPDYPPVAVREAVANALITPRLLRGRLRDAGLRGPLSESAGGHKPWGSLWDRDRRHDGERPGRVEP